MTVTIMQLAYAAIGLLLVLIVFARILPKMTEDRRDRLRNRRNRPVSDARLRKMWVVEVHDDEAA